MLMLEPKHHNFSIRKSITTSRRMMKVKAILIQVLVVLTQMVYS